MKKFLIPVLALFLASSAAATTIQSENITVDLENSEATADIYVEDLTSSAFTYITSYPVQNVNVKAAGRELECETTSLQIGTEINCETDLRKNFIVHMNFTGQGFITRRGEAEIFNYAHSVYRPTNEYRLKVILPSGTGLIDQQNSSTPVVSPTDYELGSNGRKIFVEWNENPKIGETLRFTLVYENFSSTVNYIKIISVVLSATLLIGISYTVWKRKNRDHIEEIYDELSEDEIDVIELIRENNGRMLQKDVVNSSEYSKAKISGVVSGLVDKEILDKEKEGRSNKLTISKKFSG